MQFIIAGVFWCFRTDLVALGLGDVSPPCPVLMGAAVRALHACFWRLSFLAWPLLNMRTWVSGLPKIIDREASGEEGSGPQRNKPQTLGKQFPTVFGHWLINVKIAPNEIFQLVTTCWITLIQPDSKITHTLPSSIFFFKNIFLVPYLTEAGFSVRTFWQRTPIQLCFLSPSQPSAEYLQMDLECQGWLV